MNSASAKSEVEKSTAVRDNAVAAALRRVPWSRIGMPLVILLLAVFFGALNPNFWSLTNLTNVARQVSILALISVGETFAILSAGIDLSVGSLLAFVSVVTASAMLNWGMGVGMLAGVLAATGAGLVNGVLIAKARIPPFIATLAMLVAARGAALTISGGLPISGLPKGFLTIGAGYILGIPIPAIIAAVVMFIGFLILTRSRFGRYVYAMGGNEEAATLSGINVPLNKIMVYGFSGLCAGIAGVVLTSRVISGQPTLGEVQELYAIAAVVIGGSKITGGYGSIGKTLMGVLVLGLLNNGLNLIRVSSYVQLIIIGAIIVLAVYIDMLRERRQ